MWTHIINFGVGIALRLFNEHQKSKEKEHKMMLAAATQRQELIDHAKADLKDTPFLQSVMLFMVVSAFIIVAGFSLVAAALDQPLVVETIVKKGFWIFSHDVTEFKEISGVFLPEEFRLVVIAATEFIFGAIVGGIGRR